VSAVAAASAGLRQDLHLEFRRDHPRASATAAAQPLPRTNDQPGVMRALRVYAGHRAPDRSTTVPRAMLIGITHRPVEDITVARSMRCAPTGLMAMRTPAGHRVQDADSGLMRAAALVVADVLT